MEEENLSDFKGDKVARRRNFPPLICLLSDQVLSLSSRNSSPLFHLLAKMSAPVTKQIMYYVEKKNNKKQEGGPEDLFLHPLKFQLLSCGYST